MHRLLLSLLLLAGLLGAQGVSALDPELDLERYDIQRWTTSDGLPLNAVTAISGTRDGYLWVGTQEGLARFDGVKFTVFRRRETPLLGDSFISALLEDREGRLWIGTRQGLVCYEDGAFSRYTEGDGLPRNYVRTLLVDSHGDLWVGTYGGGIARWREGQIQAFGAASGQASSLASEPEMASKIVRAIHEDMDRDLWVGTSGGLYRLDGDRRDGKGFLAMGEEAGLLGASIRAIAEDAEGTLWVATDDGRLLERRDGTFHMSEALAVEGTAATPLTALYRDRHDALWVGTQGGGLARISKGVASWLREDQGLAHNAVGSFYEDGSGGLWVGTRGGLNRLSPPRLLALTEDEGLSGNFVRAILETRNGDLWIGSEDGGLSVVRDGEVITSPLEGRFAGEAVRSLFEDPRGDLWVGTRTGVVKATGERPVRLTTEDGLPNNSVNAMAAGAPGSGLLWIGTARGLARLGNDGVETVSLEAGAADSGDRQGRDLVRCLHRDRGGALWVCTEHGLVRWTEGEEPRRFTVADGLESDFTYSIHEDGAGVLWIGTASGLARFDGASFYVYTTDQGLFSDLIFRVLEDGKKNLWLSCARGIFRVSKRDLDAVRRGQVRAVTSTWFDASDGMPSSECNGGTQPAGWKSRDGRLWFPTLRGVVAIDPLSLDGSPAPPPVVIESLEVDGETISLAASGDQGFVIPSGSQTLEIHFTAPVFRSPEKVRFRYLLEGYERRWTAAVKRRSAVYTRLPHGTYRFRVASAFQDERWSPEASVLVTVEPRFFETTGFLLLAASVVGLFLAVAYWLRRRRREQRERVLRERVEERTNQLEVANRELGRLAAIDPLTGIANQRQFRHVLHKEWRRMARSGKSLGLLLIDVDDFKAYNDTYGHLEGDACLIKVSEILSRTLARRAGDLVARYGGEEFAAVLPEADLDATRVLGEALRRAVEELHIEHRGSSVSSWVTVSVGAAAVQPRRGSPLGAVDQLMGEADGALYASKRAGRNQVT